MNQTYVSPNIFSEETELTLLGLMLSSPEAANRVLAQVDPEHFYLDSHQKLFGIMADMYAQGKPVDMATVVVHMKEANLFDADLTPATITQLPLIDSHNADYWVSRLKGVWQRRAVYQSCGDMIMNLERPEAIEGDAFNHIVDRHTTTVAHAIQSADDSADSRSRLRASLFDDLSRNDAGLGWSPGWAQLERQLGRIVPGKMLVLSSYSNQGKSTLLANIFVRLLLQGASIAAFPTEMGRDWFHRVVAIWARVVNNDYVPYQNIERGLPLEEREFFAYEKAAIQLFEGPIPGRWELNARASMTPTSLMAGMRLYQRAGFNVFMIDHGDRIMYDPANYERHRADTCIQVRNFAKDTDSFVFMAYQPRKPDSVTGDLTRPLTDAEIRGRSEIWNEADMTLFPYRPMVRCSEITGSTEYGPDGTPEILHRKGDRDGVNKNEQKLDDENFHVKVGKRRAGGEGDVCFMPFCKISGAILGRVITREVECTDQPETPLKTASPALDEMFKSLSPDTKETLDELDLEPCDGT